MKTVKLAGLYGALIATLLFSITSCSKSSNSSPTAGSMSFQWSGQSVTMPGALDTVHDFTFIATGIFPGTKDTCQVNIVVPNLSLVSTFTLKGIYSDTSVNYDNTATFALIDPVSGDAYQDNTGSLSPFTLDITSNNGSTITANFSGMVYRTNGTGPDSLMISGGHLTVTY